MNMNNLSSNSSPAMKIPVLTAIDQSQSTRYRQNVEILKSVFFSYFEQMVDVCCMRIDIELGLHLAKNREKADKETFKNSLDYLRSERSVIKKLYLDKLHHIIDHAYQKVAKAMDREAKTYHIALASDGYVKEDYSSVLIIRQCEREVYEQLTELNRQLSIVLGKSAFGKQNPFAPETLVRTLQEVLGPLKIGSDCRVALYKIFEEHVFNQLGFIYEELIKQCLTIIDKESSELKQLKASFEAAGSDAEAIKYDFQKLQRQLDAWRVAQGSTSYDLLGNKQQNYYEHFEIHNALQILSQFYRDRPAGLFNRTIPLKRHVLKKLEELNFSGDLKSLDRSDEDILDLIALIFDKIALNKGLSEDVLSALMSLEIPLATASLGQYGVFVAHLHPIKQVINDLFSVGLFLNPGNEDEQLIHNRLLALINKIKQQTNPDMGFWIVAATELSTYLAARQQIFHDTESATIKTCRDHDLSAVKKQHISQKIQDCLQKENIPPSISDFLHDVWSEVLLRAYLAKDAEPELWKQSRQTMKQLIMSVLPPANDVQRRKILSFLPELLLELRNGMNVINIDEAAQSRFFKELAMFHLLLASKKDIKQIVSEYPQVFAAVQPVPRNLSDIYSERANALAIQSWVVFTGESVKRWGKLAWKSQNSENLLFVSKNGEKISIMTVGQLADAFRQGLAKVLDQDARPLTEQVLLDIARASS